MFVKIFYKMFDEYKYDNFALFEDDLYFEKSYINNVGLTKEIADSIVEYFSK